jgi:succinyl-diaminopimelate desuccinylase
MPTAVQGSGGPPGEATEVVELARRLVAVDSQNPGGGEAAIASMLEPGCREQGFIVERLEFLPGRPNLLVSMDSGPGLHLGLSGHLDTKPIGEGASSLWDSNPFDLTVKGGRAYGLGAADMRGGGGDGRCARAPSRNRAPRPRHIGSDG